VLVVGAYDGIENDALARFIVDHPCHGIFVEPQLQAFEQLRANLASRPHFQFVNAAIDERSGTREFFEVDILGSDLPAWTAQLASFDRGHIEKHETRAPGVSARIRSRNVQACSFDDLLDRFDIRELDILQMDTEGFDARLLRWFPFHRVKPGVLHYEVAHMTGEDRLATKTRLEALGYRVLSTSSAENEMAVAI
jgi:FkbM family methyltransferase